MKSGDVIQKISRRKKLIVGLALPIILLFIGIIKLPTADVIRLGFKGMRMAAPIGLVAVGEVLNEKGGLFNIGLEGLLLMSAFASVFVGELTGSWIGGLVGGIATGAFISLIFALITTYGKGNQMIAGVGINMFAGGFIAYFIWQLWTPGQHLTDISLPRIGTQWGQFSWMFLVAIGLAIFVYFLLHETKFGVRVRSVGHNPFVADASGVDVYKMRIIACVFGGALAGLAGSHLALGWVGGVTKEIASGRGFIALACVVFSGLRPMLALGAATIFGFADGISLWMRTVPWAKPLMGHGGQYFFYMLPYVIVLLTLIFAKVEGRFPKSLGQPYHREE